MENEDISVKYKEQEVDTKITIAKLKEIKRLLPTKSMSESDLMQQKSKSSADIKKSLKKIL